MNAYHLLGFRDQLQKEAAVGDWLGRTFRGHYARQLGLGAGLGAVGGGALGAVRPVEEDVPGGRLQRIVSGARTGALAGLGIAGGRALATKGGREALGRAAKKQVYELTGKGVPTVEEAQRLKILGATPTASELSAFHSGEHTLPGVVHGMLTSPWQTMKSGWGRAGWVGKGFAGLGAVGAVKGALEKPEEGGPGRAEKALRGAGETVGWLVAPAGILAGQLVGSGAGAVAGRLGRSIDTAAGAVRPPQEAGL